MTVKTNAQRNLILKEAKKSTDIEVVLLVKKMTRLIIPEKIGMIIGISPFIIGLAGLIVDMDLIMMIELVTNISIPLIIVGIIASIGGIILINSKKKQSYQIANQIAEKIWIQI